MELALKVKKLADKFKVPLIIDDRVSVAMALECGVHLGAEDLPINYAKKLMPNSIIGVTAKKVDITKAQQDGATYLGVGAIFDTLTKVKTVRTSV